MGKIIAIANHSGKVAKTTITHNLGVALAQKGKKTLMVDLDSKGSLTSRSSTQSPLKYLNCNIVAALDPETDKNLNDCVISVGVTDTVKQNLFLVPSIIDLAVIENRINTHIFGKLMLARKLAQVINKYDYILLDCPPSLGVLTTSALAAADGVIIPCRTDNLSYRGLLQFIQIIDEIRKWINHNLNMCGIIGTMYDCYRDEHNQIIQQLIKETPYITTIRKAPVPHDGVFDGISAVEYVPDHAISIGAKTVADLLIRGSFNEKK